MPNLIEVVPNSVRWPRRAARRGSCIQTMSAAAAPPTTKAAVAPARSGDRICAMNHRSPRYNCREAQPTARVGKRHATLTWRLALARRASRRRNRLSRARRASLSFRRCIVRLLYEAFWALWCRRGSGARSGSDTGRGGRKRACQTVDPDDEATRHPPTSVIVRGAIERAGDRECYMAGVAARSATSAAYAGKRGQSPGAQPLSAVAGHGSGAFVELLSELVSQPSHPDRLAILELAASC